MKNLTILLGIIFMLLSFARDESTITYKATDVKVTTINGNDIVDKEASSEMEVVNLSGSEGSITSDIFVNSSGGLNYSIPINVPPGLNGVVPEISLDFDSHNGRGMAGWGWNVSGVSVITRIPSTLFHDNQIDPVDFDSGDRFALDGQRLVLKTGTYGGSGSTYQTENYSNLKIIGEGNNPLSFGPANFKVIYPDGSIAFYGSTSGSRTPMDYAISYWENPQGVRISYEYSGKYISRIKYGSKGNDPAINEVRFTYLSGSIGKHKESAYVGGGHFQNSTTLDKIEVYGNSNTLYRKYELVYDKTIVNYQRLIEVKEYPNSGSNRSVTFEYGDTSYNFVEVSGTATNLSVSNINRNNSKMIPGDFSGNGKMDFVIYPTTGPDTKKKFWIFDDIQNSNGFNYANGVNIGSFQELFSATWLNSQSNLMPGQGLVAVQNTGVKDVKFTIMAKEDGGPLSTKYTKTWNAPGVSYQLESCSSTYQRIQRNYYSGDFDGDGLTDVIALSKGLNDSRICYPDGGGSPGNECNNCSTQVVYPRDAHLIKLDRRLTSSNDFSSSLGQFPQTIGIDDQIFTVDVTGDGRTNIVIFKGITAVVYGLNETNSSLVELWRRTVTEAFNYDFQFIPGDFNGDGKTDFLLPQEDNSPIFRMLSSEGNAFDISQGETYTFFNKTDVSFGTPKYTYDLLPVDINGDGKTDILEYSTVTYGNGTGTQYITPHLITSPKEFLKLGTETVFGTLNHYPVPVFLPSSMPNNNLDFGVISNKFIRSFSFGLDHREDMMLEKINNNGVSTTITYDPVDPNYEGGDSPPPQGYINSYFPKTGQVYPFVNVNVAPSFKVVRRLDQTASGVNRTKLFYYEGAVSHATGLGFQGFEIVKRSGWYGDNVIPLWTITKRNPLLRGVITEQVTAISSDSDPSDFQRKVNYFYDYQLIANPGSPIAPQYTENINRNSSLPGAETDEAEISINLLPGFHAIGSNGAYWGFITPPNEQPGDDGYAGAVDVRLNRTETNNGLTGVVTTETYSYDEFNNPLITNTSFPGGSRVLTYQYSNNASATNNTYHIGKPLKMTERLTLNGSSFTTEEEYEYNNNLVETIRRKGNGTDWITQDIEYNLQTGNIITKTLSAGSLTPRIQRFEYGADDRFLTKYTDIDGQVTTFTYEASTGLLKSTTDSYGLTTQYGHDIWGRVTSETDYLNQTTQYGTQYQPDGGTKTTIDYPQGSKEESTYNAFGWETRTGQLSLNNEWSYVSFEYDASGRLIRESEPHNGSPSQWNVTNFNEYSQITSQVLYTGRTITATYNGLSTTVNDGAKTVETTLDALGNTVRVTDPGGTIDYTYHASGQLKSADYGGHLVTVGVDGWGRKTSLTDPSTGTYTYKYNDYGELLEQVSPKGVTEYKYDDEGKLKKKIITGEFTDWLIEYKYDEADTKQIEKITGTDNLNSGRSYVYDYVYDNYERLESITENTGLASFAYEIDYDPTYGRVWKETQTATLAGGISKSITTRNEYDTSGILTEIWNDGTPDKLWELSEINARGQELTVNLGNGMTQTKLYDSFGYLEKIEDKETGTNPTTALRMEYNFNAQRGTLSDRENFGFSWQETFQYDSQDRLLSITGDVSHSRTYMDNGNVSNNGDLGDYLYGDSNKKYRLTEIDPNAAGETYFQQHPTQQISYNVFKKPVDIHQTGHGRVSFDYGPLMNRSTAYYGGEQEDRTQRRYKKHYSAITSAEIVQDTQTGTNKIITYVGGDAYTAPVVHIKEDGGGSTLDEYHYLHRDYLGSILAITDADGDVKEERQFGAWGVVDQFLDSSGGTTFDHAALLGRGYTGHEHFFEVGLIHMNGRMYDAQLGRFLSPDNYVQEPFNTQSYNRYGYAFNNPLSYTDPSGEFLLEALTFAKIITAVVKGIFYVSAAIGAYAILKNHGLLGGGNSSSQTSASSPGNTGNNTQAASSRSSSGRRSAFNDGGLVALNLPAVDTGGVSNLTIGENLSYTNPFPTGISTVGRADPLQGVPKPEGWEFNPEANARQFAEPESQGFNITAEDVIDTTLDFIPIVGGAKDIYKGIRDGNGWQVALGVGSLALDIFTLGSASVVKGAVKTGIKAGGKSLAKKGGKNLVKKVPNPYGRRGSPAHVERVLEAERRLTPKGSGWRTISGGSLPEARSLSGRYADLVIQKKDKIIAIQVGRATKRTRLPIARERRAIKDLRDSGEFDHVFFLEYK
ncbi:RHS repeat-associated core domain-containing protein [Flagellimonas sp. S174]|uniref:RHS repeat-associated core domain-containing protein n=1 Tax=Flagellimonas sp. S174 TaxID=3410790 RepID=UPI003BF4D538